MSRGRPTTRTAALIDRIIARIELGAKVPEACAQEGLKYKTFTHWTRQDTELRARVLRARAEALA